MTTCIFSPTMCRKHGQILLSVMAVIKFLLRGSGPAAVLEYMQCVLNINC